MEKLNFDRRCVCDWCGCKEICAVTHHGTSHYNRLICLECALSINCNEKLINGGVDAFDLNNSTIRFKNFEFDCNAKDYDEHYKIIDNITGETRETNNADAYAQVLEDAKQEHTDTDWYDDGETTSETPNYTITTKQYFEDGAFYCITYIDEK